MASTVCRFQVTGFRKKDNRAVEVAISSQRKAAKMLRLRPPGSYLIRLAKDALTAKKSPVFIALKFDTSVVHHTLSGLDCAISSGKEEGIVARLDSRAFALLCKILEFLPSVQVLARQVISNKNFFDQLLSDSEVAQELAFKEYIIYTNMGNIIIHRRKKVDSEVDDALQARVVIEWEQFCFFASVNGPEQRPTPILDFNTFLLEFLQVRSVDRYEIMGILGYNPQDMQEAVSKKSGSTLKSADRYVAKPPTARGSSLDSGLGADTIRSHSPLTPRSSSPTAQAVSPVEVGDREKAKLMARLRYHYHQKDGPAPEPPRDILAAIYKNVSAIAPDDKESRLQWVDAGLLFELTLLLCKHADSGAEPEEPVKIIKRLIRNNPEASVELCRVMLVHLRKHFDCVRVYQLVENLIKMHSFRKVFLENRGAHILLDFYERTLVILHGRQYDRTLDFPNDPQAEESVDALLSPSAAAAASEDKSEKEYPPSKLSQEGTSRTASPELDRRLGMLEKMSSDGAGVSTNSETADEESSLASETQQLAASEMQHLTAAAGGGVSATSSVQRAQSPRTHKRNLEKAIVLLEAQRSTFPGGESAANAALAEVRTELSMLEYSMKRKEEIAKLRDMIASMQGMGVDPNTIKGAVKPLEDRLAVLCEADKAAEAAAKRRLGASSSSSGSSTSGEGSTSGEDEDETSTHSSTSDDDEGTAPKTPEPATGSANSRSPLRPGLKPLSLRLPAGASLSPRGESDLPPPITPKTPSVIPGLSLAAKGLTSRGGGGRGGSGGSGSPTSPGDSGSPIWTGSARSNVSGDSSGSFLKRGSLLTSQRPSDSLTETDFRDSAALRQTSKETAHQRLTALAIKLGETFMASDLTALLQLKKQAAPPMRDKGLQTRVELEEQKPVNKHIVEFRKSKGYTIKMAILHVLALLAAEPCANEFFDPPINLLLSELCASHKDRFLRSDDDFRLRIFSVLAPYAIKVETVHKVQWPEVVERLPSLSAKFAFRSKLDVFLFRINEQLSAARGLRSPADHRAVQAYTTMLVDYLRHCYTRVVVANVMDVCAEVMLTIARHLFDANVDLVNAGPDVLRTVMHVLHFFDELALVAYSPAITELLVSLFIENDQFWLFTRHLSGELFLNSKLCTALKDHPTAGRDFLKQLRLRVLGHLRACVTLVERHYREAAAWRQQGHVKPSSLTTLVDNSLLVRLMLTKFEFLVMPGAGLIPQFFDGHRSPYDQYHVKMEMLRLLVELFGFPESPLVTRSLKYIDFYISDSYLSFIKLFNSNDFDEATLQMCRLYIEVLIRFSRIKESSVRMKMSQLRVMDFLANQIDLEYQMTLLADASASQAPEKYATLSAVTENIAMRRSPRPERRNAITEAPPNLPLARAVDSSAAPPPALAISTSSVVRATATTTAATATAAVAAGGAADAAANGEESAAPSHRASSRMASSRLVEVKSSTSRSSSSRSSSRSASSSSSASASSSSSGSSSGSDSQSDGESGDSKRVVPPPMGVKRIPRTPAAGAGSSPASASAVTVSKPPIAMRMGGGGLALPSTASPVSMPTIIVSPGRIKSPGRSVGASAPPKVSLPPAPGRLAVPAATSAPPDDCKEGVSADDEPERSSSSGSSSASSSSETDEAPPSRAPPMGVIRIPRVKAAAAAPEKSAPPPPALSIAPPLSSSGTLVAKSPSQARRSGIPSVVVPASTTPSFTLRFGAGKVQEWDVKDDDSKAKDGASASASSGDEEESDHKDESVSSSESSAENTPQTPKQAMSVKRIPRADAASASPLRMSPARSPSMSTPSSPSLGRSTPQFGLRLTPSITKDGSYRGTSAAAAASGDRSSGSTAPASATSSPQTPKRPTTPLGGSVKGMPMAALRLTPNLTKDGSASSAALASSPVSSSPATPPSHDLTGAPPREQLSARYETHKASSRPTAHFSTVAARRPNSRAGIELGSLFAMSPAPARPLLSESVDDWDEDGGVGGAFTSRDLYGDMIGLHGLERTKIKAFTRLFASPLWGEKNEPVKSKIEPVRWLRVKTKELLAAIAKVPDAAQLQGSKVVFNPMGLPGGKRADGESSSSTSDDEADLKSPGRLKLASPRGTSSPALGGAASLTPRKFGRPAFGVSKVPELKVPTKDDSTASSPKSRQPSAGSEKKKDGLSALQAKMHNTDGPRMELLTKEQAEQKKKLDTAALYVRNEEYERRRGDSKLYALTDLHLSILTLLLDLMINDIGVLDPLYVSQFPVTDKKLNIPFYLRLHLNHPANRAVIPELASRLHELGTPQYRLLKLLSTQLFQRSFYKELEQVAKGAYGVVHKAKLERDRHVAVKMMALPNTLFDRCVLHDIFTEVTLLDMYRADSRSCHLYDYGVDDENYWLVMQWYVTSLRGWRKRQTRPLSENLPLYLNVFMAVLNAMQFLPDHHTNHYDLKCDNFLLQPLHRSIPEEEIYNQPTSTPNFTVALADFGEAKIFSPDKDRESEQYTFRNRGTEYIKSPEMLLSAYANKKEASTYDRLARKGANSASDIWSLGCLFFELLTGEFLFYDDDWVKFFLRVTQGADVLTAEKKALIDDNVDLIKFFNFVLQRKQQYRPSLPDVVQRFLHLRATLTQKTPRYVPIPPKVVTQPVIKPANRSSASEGGDGSKPMTPSSAKNSPSQLTGSPLCQPANDDVYTPEEQSWFMTHASEVFPRVYLSSLFVASNREQVKVKLGITHMVNVSNNPDPFPNEFEYLTLDVLDEPRQLITPMIQRFLDFVKRAVYDAKGTVLIFSARGVSRAAAFAIAWIMEERNWSYYESFIWLKDRRYVVNPNQGLARQLTRWGQRKPTDTLVFQCHCGACTFGVVRAAHPVRDGPGDLPTAAPAAAEETGESEDALFVELANGPKCIVMSGNMLACHCDAPDASVCPLLGCQAALEAAHEKHAYLADNLIWTFASAASAQLQHVAYVTAPLPRGARPGWTVYRCRTCEFVTHATLTQAGAVKCHALVSNLPVAANQGGAAKRTASVLLNPQFRLSKPPSKAADPPQASEAASGRRMQLSVSSVQLSSSPVKPTGPKPSTTPVSPLTLLRSSAKVALRSSAESTTAEEGSPSGAAPAVPPKPTVVVRRSTGSGVPLVVSANPTTAGSEPLVKRKSTDQMLGARRANTLSDSPDARKKL